MTVAGTWENDYGSRMTLSVEGCLVHGLYESTTGSTGQYCVAGWQTSLDPTRDAGQAVALSIAWHSIVDGVRDASWSWVSALSGQISLVEGEEILTLNHLLVASSDFERICGRGVYSDKLSYRRTGGALVGERRSPTIAAIAAIDDPLAGRWCARNGAGLDLSVAPDDRAVVGLVRGELRLGTDTLTLFGFTDIGAECGQDGYQSVAVAAVDQSVKTVMGLGGWIDPCSASLHLQILASSPTPPGNAYVQTELSCLEFDRHG